MNNIITWIKSNKVPAALIAVLAFIAFSGLRGNPMPLSTSQMGYGNNLFNSKMGARDTAQYDSFSATDMMPVAGGRGNGGTMYNESAPRLDITDRMVVTNSYLSLVVKNVRESIDSISSQTSKIGGYVVNMNLSTPEGLSSGDVTIRVPVRNLDTMLSFLRESAAKVVTENVNGNDITDQFVDTEARLKTLQTTKTKYEEILNKTSDVEQILIVTDRIISIQSQIDSIKGQLEYMNQSAQSTLITVYLSTDELELPFAPEGKWDAKLVFKYAVRALIEDARSMAGSIIWLAVYAIFWVPALIIFLVVKKNWKKSQQI